VTTREYRVVLVAVVGLMIVAMAFVWSNVRLVGLAYEYQALDKTKRSLLRVKMDEKLIFKKINSRRSFVWIKRKVSPAEIARLRRDSPSGVNFSFGSLCVIRFRACREVILSPSCKA